MAKTHTIGKTFTFTVQFDDNLADTFTTMAMPGAPVIINKKWFDTLTSDQQAFVLRHEMRHAWHKWEEKQEALASLQELTKSQIVSEWCKARGIPVVDLQMVDAGPIDLRGYPDPVANRLPTTSMTASKHPPGFPEALKPFKPPVIEVTASTYQAYLDTLTTDGVKQELLFHATRGRMEYARLADAELQRRETQ